jgi:hypothetical protein
VIGVFANSLQALTMLITRSPLAFDVVVVVVLMIRQAKASWVDPDTTLQAQITRSLYEKDARPFQLVFSDEFEQDGRTFHDGSDPRWTAIHKNDCESIFFKYILNRGLWGV